jgi:hypothetical protein
MPDKKAQEILFNTYWSSAGWRKEPNTPPQDYLYALNAGYMFEPVVLSHDDIIVWLKKIFKKIEMRKVTDAFLSSLTTRRLDLRSALGSYAIARHFPSHRFFGDDVFCEICEEVSQAKEPQDLNVLNFERLKWGGVRHLSPLYIAFDLEQFTKLSVPLPEAEDLEIFSRIIQAAKSLPTKARPSDLEKALAKLIKSNQAERSVLLEILGYCGILEPTKHSSFFRQFVNYKDREERPVSKIDWDYPISWWTGAEGVNQEALKYFFPYL